MAQEIVRRLRATRDRRDFARVHWCPDAGGADVPDEMVAGLIVLHPDARHSRSGDSEAMRAAQSILERRGNSPRQYRNTLVFVGLDREGAAALEAEVRSYLAWQSIVRYIAVLNLDQLQVRQAKENADRSNGSVDLKVATAYNWLLVPYQEGAGPWQWETTALDGGDGSLPERASRKLRGAEQLITRWSPALLRMELDRWLWRDAPHLSVKRLWEYLCTYGYLPRLKDREVLLTAIADGLRSRDYFGYAGNVVPGGRYEDLIFGQATLPTSIHLDHLSVLVKPEAGAAQEADDARREAELLARHTGTTSVPPPSAGAGQVASHGRGELHTPAPPKGKEPSRPSRNVVRQAPSPHLRGARRWVSLAVPVGAADRRAPRPMRGQSRRTTGLSDILVNHTLAKGIGEPPHYRAEHPSAMAISFSRLFAGLPRSFTWDSCGIAIIRR